MQLFHKNTTSFYFLFGAIIFILGTAFATAISRNQYGIYVFLTSKYKIYSILLACILYFLLLVNFKYFGKNVVFIIALLLSIYANIGSYFYSLAEIKNYFKSENASYFNGWHKNGKLEIADENSCYKYKNTFLDRPIFELPKLKGAKIRDSYHKR